MSSKVGDIYSALFREYKAIHSSKKTEVAQKEFNVIWSKLKADADNNTATIITNAESLLKSYKEENTRKKGSSLLTFFSKTPRFSEPAASSTQKECRQGSSSQGRPSQENPSQERPGQEKSSQGEPSQSSREKPIEDSIPSTSTHPPSSPSRGEGLGGSGDGATKEIEEEDSDENPVGGKRRRTARPVIASDSEDEQPRKPRETKAQDQLKAKIVLLESKLNTAILARDSGFGDENAQATVNQLRRDLAEAKKQLEAKMAKAQRERKYRANRRTALKKIVEKDPEVAKELKVRNEPGRPRIETDQPGLLQAIVDIAIVGGAAEERRRSDLIRTCRTLDDLNVELEKKGFRISRTACALRLIPHNSRSSWGLRHVATVNVKLCRPQADAHKFSPDGKFCVATIRSMETIAALLGADQVIFISQDDKARIPIGITAANKQAPLLMHVEYRVKLPDHDFIVALRHKLIASVYILIKINNGSFNGDPSAVSYSGPVYVAIRSGKHDSSSASTHAFDLRHLMTIDAFQDSVKVNDAVKPVLMMSVDGGPDENPRYPMVMKQAVETFKEYDLDAVFVFTNAPGRSAFNRAERVMAPLTKAMAGLILPHDTFGSHLDDNGRTVDEEKELQNFKAAGECLAQVWDGMELDKHPVCSEYISPGTGECPPPNEIDDQWHMDHIRESQYFLQIVKCNNEACCKPFRSDLKLILPGGFLPPPYVIRRSSDGRIEVPEPDDVHSTENFAPLLVRQSIAAKPKGEDLPTELPYDAYCPSLKGAAVKDRICPHCGIYFAAKKHVTDHARAVHKQARKQPKTRPKAILRERAEEILCVVDLEDGEEDVRWLAAKDVDSEGIIQIQPESGVDGLPVIGDLAAWIESPWMED